MPIAVGTTRQILPWLRDRGLRIDAARVDGDILYTDADLRPPVAIVLGNEAEGLSAAWMAPTVQTIRLPMYGKADSLNVSAAAAVLFYESLRQRTVS